MVGGIVRKNAEVPKGVVSDLPSTRMVRATTVPRLGLSISEAALYIGIGQTQFRAMVDDGRMPKPRMIGTRRIWDVDELYASFKSLPHEKERDTSWDDWAPQ